MGLAQAGFGNARLSFCRMWRQRSSVVLASARKLPSAFAVQIVFLPSILFASSMLVSLDAAFSAPPASGSVFASLRFVSLSAGHFAKAITQRSTMIPPGTRAIKAKAGLKPVRLAILQNGTTKKTAIAINHGARSRSLIFPPAHPKLRWQPRAPLFFNPGR